MLDVKVRNREARLFEGKAEAFTSFNAKGVFDVLPGHANFISLIKDKLILHKQGRQKEQIEFQAAALKVYQDKVDVYIVS